jgi:rod shape-determining protein MreC
MNTTLQKYIQTGILILIVAGIILLGLSGYLSSIVSSSTSPIIGAQRWITTRYLAVYEFLTVPRDVESLTQRNAELQDEVSRLQTQIIQLDQQLREAQVLYALLGFAREHSENQYVASTVIGKDPSPFLNYIIIDHGSDSGIRHGMPVVTQQGLVGRVDAVIAGAARVQLITDSASAVNVHFQNQKIDAVLEGSVTGDVSVQMISQEVNITPGELVLTSGLGGEYPADILVGQVVNVRKLETDLFQSATVQTAVDFSTIRAVLVITNFKPVDITPLISTPSP